MKLLILLMLLFSGNASAEVFVGYSRTYHIISKGLNDNHVFAGIESKYAGIMAFQNSFNKVSFGVYLQYSHEIKKNINITARYGAVTGYDEIMMYNGKEYITGDTHIGDIMIVISPSIRYNMINYEVFIEVLGDAIGVGVEYEY